MDISKSVVNAEEKRLAVVEDKLSKLSDDLAWEVSIVPIHGALGRSKLTAWNGELPRNEFRGNASADATHRARCRVIIKEAMGATRDYLSEARGRKGEYQTDTCILAGIHYAAAQLIGDAEHGTRMLIIVSDLVEECSRTGLDMRARQTAGDSLWIAARAVYPMGSISGIEIDVYQCLSHAAENDCPWLEYDVVKNQWSRFFKAWGVNDPVAWQWD